MNLQIRTSREWRPQWQTRDRRSCSFDGCCLIWPLCLLLWDRCFGFSTFTWLRFIKTSSSSFHLFFLPQRGNSYILKISAVVGQQSTLIRKYCPRLTMPNANHKSITVTWLGSYYGTSRTYLSLPETILLELPYRILHRIGPGHSPPINSTNYPFQRLLIIWNPHRKHICRGLRSRARV